MGPEILTRNLWLKLTALGLAVLLWIVVRGPTRTVVQAPIEVVVEDPGWTLARPPEPDTATVVFQASSRDLLTMVGQPTRLVVSVQQVNDTARTVDLDTRMVRVGDATANPNDVAQVTPSRVRLRFEPVESALRPVSVRLQGQLPQGVGLAHAVTVRPSMVRVSGARSRLLRLDSVPTRPLSLSGLTRPETLDVYVDTAALHGFLVSPRRLTAFVPARVQPDTTQPDTTRPDTAAARKGGGGGPGSSTPHHSRRP